MSRPNNGAQNSVCTTPEQTQRNAIVFACATIHHSEVKGCRVIVIVETKVNATRRENAINLETDLLFSIMQIEKQEDKSGLSYVMTFLFIVFNVTMSGKDMALELFWIAIPELCGLAVQRARTVFKSLLVSDSRTAYQKGVTYLLGSPSRLCRLRSTFCTLYTALHWSFNISKQIRPEKSTLGW